jgi:hypothetical protein
VVARQERSTWRREEIEMVQTAVLKGVEVDPSGALVVLYDLKTGTARLATNACGPWEYVDLEDVSGATLAIDRLGRPTVAYGRPEPEGGLWLATLEEVFAE